MAGGDRTKGLSKSCILLLVLAGVERFAFKGVQSNMVTYLTDVVKLSNSSAAKIVNSWVGITFMVPLLGALLADSYWDRYSTILASSLLYFVGLLALTLRALKWSWIPASKANSCVSLFLSFSVISLAQGGYNPSLQAFGTDQLENEDELPSTNKDDKNSGTKSLFFNRWYIGICGGSLLGITLMSYIEDTYGWVVGFAIPAVAMAASVVCFSCGTRFYTYKQPKGEGNHIESITQVIRATVLKMVNCRMTRIVLPVNQSHASVELEMQDKPLCNRDMKQSESIGEDTNKRLDLRDRARVVVRLLPMWTLLLMFSVVFQQPPTFFTKQGMTMKRNIGNRFLIPPATLQSTITLSIVLLMPLYDKMIIPALRFITRNDKGITVTQRMGIGMFLTTVAIVIAAMVETKRLGISRRMGVVESEYSATVPLSIFWLLPQYVLLGISDVFAVVGMQEFFYTQVPARMKTMGIALYFSVFGVGSFLSAAMISVIERVTSSSGGRGGGHSWFSDDMKEARLDKFYWLLALGNTLSFLFFVCLCKYYGSQKSSENETCK